MVLRVEEMVLMSVDRKSRLQTAILTISLIRVLKLLKRRTIRMLPSLYLKRLNEAALNLMKHLITLESLMYKICQVMSMKSTKRLLWKLFVPINLFMISQDRQDNPWQTLIYIYNYRYVMQDGGYGLITIASTLPCSWH